MICRQNSVDPWTRRNFGRGAPLLADLMCPNDFSVTPQTLKSFDDRFNHLIVARPMLNLSRGHDVLESGYLN